MLIRFVALFFSALNIAVYPSLPSAQKTTRAEISIRIEAMSPETLRGEPISIRIELMNLADKDLCVSRNLTGTGSNPGDITFEVTDASGRAEAGERAAVDCFMKANPDSLPIAVMKRWIALPPGTSFRTTLKLGGPSSFLQRPGRYKVSAIYESRGIKEQYWTDCVHATAEEIAKLPFSAWEGKVESNSIWIEVKTAPRSPTR